MISFETTFLDYPSPDDIAVIVFMSGCDHACPGCQNLSLQKIISEYTQSDINNIILHIKDLCNRNETNKIVLSGGDPLFIANRNLTKQICEELENIYDICIYTGYSIDQIKELDIKGFKYIKSGKFDCNNIQKAEKTDRYIQFVNPTQNLFDSHYNQLSIDGRFNF